MNLRSVIPVVLIVCLLAGCGSTSSDSSDKSTATPSSKPAKKSRPQGYKAKVRKCLEDVGYELKQAGNATRVQTPGGNAIANLQFFKTEKEAKAFYAQLEVDGDGGGKAVAIFLSGVRSDSDKNVVGDCLTP